MKKTFILFAIIFSSIFYSQNFEYERTWGTYFGATGGQIAGIYVNKGVLFDSQKNLHIRGNIWNPQNLSNVYFDQFLLGGGGLFFNQQGFSNCFETQFSPMGTPSYYGYTKSFASTLLEKIDHQDNKYYIIHDAVPSVQATAGVYLSADPAPSSAYKLILAKYSPSGVLLWATYLPSPTPAVNVEIDSDNNVYLSGTTRLTQNVATSGVLQENYDLIYDGMGNLVPSGYLLKLSPNGQRLWGTYMPSGGSSSMQYYNGALYMLTSLNTNPAINTMATPGAFQMSQSGTSITKMNTATGTREWGTYYGPPISTGFANLTDLAVNGTGYMLPAQIITSMAQAFLVRQAAISNM